MSLLLLPTRRGKNRSILALRRQCWRTTTITVKTRRGPSNTNTNTTAVLQRCDVVNNQKRFRSAFVTASSSINGVSSVSKGGSNADETAAAAIISRASLYRLVELSRQEWRLIAMSAATLGLTSSVTLLLPFASGQVIDYTIATAATASAAGGASGGGGALSPMMLATGLFGLTAAAGGGVYLRSLWLARAGNRIVARLKQQLYRSILQQEVDFIARQSTGDLLSRLSVDAQLVQAAVTNQAVAGLRMCIMSMGSASMLLYTSPTLALVSCCTLPPIFIATRIVGRKLQVQQEQVQELQGQAISLAEQALLSVSTVKQFVAEDYETIRFQNAVAKAHRKALETASMQAQLEAGAHIGGNAAVLCVLGYGGSLVLQGGISAGDLTGFVMYSLLMANNLTGLTSLYGDMVRALAASNRIFDILDRPPAQQAQIPASSTNGGVIPVVQQQPQKAGMSLLDDPLVAQEYTTINTRTSYSKTAPLAITFRDVNFRYPLRADVDVLQGFSLSVVPGQVAALVGGSGSGKSTVASLLTRLYDVHENNENGRGGGGAILINEKSILDYDPQELRRMIGIVSQEPTIFQGTIRDNIMYGEWDRVSNEQVQEAATLAHVMDFAKDFPNGLDTVVGPRGSQLSGGQRQRVAIARVLVKNPPLVIWDEATSALDAHSENLVQLAMNSVMHGNRTVLSIAHRLSTIRHPDVINVMSNGRIVQVGTFEKLSTEAGPFRELMKTQLVADVTKRHEGAIEIFH
jgi:ABC-type multidrug transport system fused ATPase/permease subunit